jgi:nitronate monooxygenase
MNKFNFKKESLLTPAFSTKEEKNSYLEAIFSSEIPFPIMNGGMGIDFSNEDLAGAVIQAGGIGVLAASLVGYNEIYKEKFEKMNMEERRRLRDKADTETLKRKIHKVRDQSPFGIIGINVMRAVDNYDLLVKVIGESLDVDILLVGAGLPMDLPTTMLQYPHMRYVPIVSSARAAQIILRRARLRKGRKPDAWYLELPQFAGGHLGASDEVEANDQGAFKQSDILEGIRRLDSDIPVILAGGIMYKSDIEAALDQGFNGVSTGTRMLLTQESGMSDDILREYYLNPDYKIVTKMTSPAGMPSRYIDNGFLTEAAKVEEETRKRCVSCIVTKNCAFFNRKTPYCIAHWLTKARRGDKDGLLFSGSRLAEMRNDSLYSRDGKPYIPTVREALDFLLGTTS